MTHAFTWESHRRADGTLDVLSALTVRAPCHPVAAHVRRATEFIDDVDELCELRTTKAAEVVLMHALQIIQG